MADDPGMSRVRFQPVKPSEQPGHVGLAHERPFEVGGPFGTLTDAPPEGPFYARAAARIALSGRIYARGRRGFNDGVELVPIALGRYGGEEPPGYIAGMWISG